MTVNMQNPSFHHLSDFDSPQRILNYNIPSAGPSSQSHMPIPSALYHNHGLGHTHMHPGLAHHYSPYPTDSIIPPGRKRPKYTRSKTGCLTCRRKKIKCDEAKPVCTRCSHAQRECDWPQDVPRKKSHRRRYTVSGNGDAPSTTANANYSPAISDSSAITKASSGHNRQTSRGEATLSCPSSPSAIPHHDHSGLPFPLVRRRSPSCGLSEGGPSDGQSDLGARDGSPHSADDFDAFRPSEKWELPSSNLKSGVNFPPSSSYNEPFNLPPSSINFDQVDYNPNGSPYSVWPQLSLNTEQTMGNASQSYLSTPTSTNLGSPSGSPSAFSYSSPFPFTLPTYQTTNIPPLFHLSTSSSQWPIIQTDGPPDPDDDVSRNSGQWSSTSALRNAAPDVLEPYFTTVGERNLIRHYCSNSTHLVMAVPASSSSLNPVLAITIPLVLSLPSNVSPAVEALRLSLLGVGAVHMAFLHSRPTPCAVPDMSSLPQKTKDLMSLAWTYRQRATLSLNEALQSPVHNHQDTALGASVSITLIDIFSGGFGYLSNLDVAKDIIKLRGGPAQMVLFNGPTKASIGNNTSVNLSAARLLLEMLTVYDTFSSFASREEPSLLFPQDPSWWLYGDDRNYHRFAVEKLFGLSREMIYIIAKISSLFTRLYRSRPPASIFPAMGSEDETTPSATPLLNPNPDLETDSRIKQEALQLYKELDTWESPSKRKGITPDSLFGIETTSVELEMSRAFQTLRCTQRVQTGNEAYRRAMQITLLCEVFDVLPSDEQIQAKCESVLTACLDCAQKFGMAVGLIWPIIIAGSVAPPSLRKMVCDFYLDFRNQCCFDANTSEQIIHEVWRRTDQGLARANWRFVIEDLNLKILVL